MASHIVSRESASLGDLLQILRLRKALIFLITALVIVTAGTVTFFLPKWYLATATVRVEKPEGEIKLFQAQSTGYYDPYFLQDQFRIMQSAKILYPVIERLGLNEKLAHSVGAATALPTDYTFNYLVRKMLDLESPRGSSMIEIGVYAQDPVLAAQIANEIATTYSSDRIDFATSEQREGLAQLRKELEAQERIVFGQRDAVETLRKDLNVSGVDINARYSDIEIETLRQMQNSLIALSVDAIGRKTRWERFKGIPSEERLSLVNTELIQDPNIQALQQAYLEADQMVTRLKGRLGEAHPELIAAVDNREKMEDQLEKLLKGYESSLEIAYKEADARVAELKSQLAQAKVDQILSARDRLRPFEEAVQKLDDESRLLTTLKLTLRQREIDFQVPKRSIEILGEARPARLPSKPSWFLNLALAAAFGGILGVGIAVLIEYLDTSFRNVGDVETKLQRPVLGVLPFVDRLATRDLQASADLEPYRVLQTNINLTRKISGGRVLMLLSAGPGEGKSSTLYNLAQVSAASGERVLLIDSDLRRPTQHVLTDRPRSPGLTDWLEGKAEFDAILQRQIAPGLDFIPAGSKENFTLGLLYADRLRALLAELRPRYDKIIFDSPPVIGVSDTSVLVSLVDDVILLIQYRRNPVSMVTRAQQIVEAVKGPLLGVVLNQVPAHAGDDYGYYTQNYSYYSDGGTNAKRRRTSDKSSAASGASGDVLQLNEPRQK